MGRRGTTGQGGNRASAVLPLARTFPFQREQRSAPLRISPEQQGEISGRHRSLIGARGGHGKRHW